MSSSWFNSKPSATPELPHTRTVTRLSDSHYPRNSVDKSAKHPTSPPIYTTPHDDILAELQGVSRQHVADSALLSTKGGHAASIDVESTITHEEKFKSKSDVNLLSVTPTPSLHASRGVSQDILLDPFDGSPLGALIPHVQDEPSYSQLNLPAGPEGGSSSNPRTNSSGEVVWTHLSRVIDLQGQISRMHIGMEGIGSGKGLDNKNHKTNHKGINPTTATTSEDPALPPGLKIRQRAMSTVSTVSSADEPEGDEGGVNMPSEEAEKTQAREEEFARLAGQFEGRREVIQDIMGKLDDLSKALSEFHALEAPSIEFPSSRQNSLAVNPPPSTFSPSSGVDGDSKPSLSRTPLLQSAAAPSSRMHDWTHQAGPSSSTLMLSVPLNRTKSDSGTLSNPLIRTPLPKKVVPALLVNSMNPGSQDQVIDSPVSTLGSLKLPPEE